MDQPTTDGGRDAGRVRSLFAAHQPGGKP
ncbi:MAG: hypothetical protein QOF82_2147, partial [Frankiales bacterium]|nr:hypothetical protein [Frankiales bacterium]